MAQADGDERVAREVGEDLHAVTEEQDQERDAVDLGEVGECDPEGLVLQVIGHHHLQEIADHQRREHRVPFDLRPALLPYLRQELVRLHHWAGHQLREEADEGGDAQGMTREAAHHDAAVIRHLALLVGIHHQADALEGEEADAHRQRDGHQEITEPAALEEAASDERAVLEEDERGQIQRYAQRGVEAPPLLIAEDHAVAGPHVDADAAHEQQQQPWHGPGIKDEARHHQQVQLESAQRGQVIERQRREDEEHEGNAVEEHGPALRRRT